MSKIELPITTARPLAEKIADALRPACQRIEIAGSIRRNEPVVGDIEIVCIAKPCVDLFGQPSDCTELDTALDLLCDQGRLVRGRCDGEKYKQFGVSSVPGLNLDMFITSPECWGVIFTIRTGSADFAHKLVTPQSRGGLLPDGLRVADGRIKPDGRPPLDTPEERDVFNALGMGWVEPEERGQSITTTQEQSR